MARTYGEIRFRLRRLAPDVDLVLLDGWILDRYQRILDRLPWQRQEEVRAFQTTEPHTAGTVTAGKGAAALTGDATLWSLELSGRMVRIAERNEFYQFTYSSPTTGELDRPYEGESGSGLAYAISQSVYPLAPETRWVDSVEIPALNRVLVKAPDEFPPSRHASGPPRFWRWYMDDLSFTPQIELYPVPDAVYSVVVHQVSDGQAFLAADTSVSMLPWVREGALVAGVQADIAANAKDYAGAQWFESQFEKGIADMMRTEAARKGPVRMRGAIEPHRVKRWLR